MVEAINAMGSSGNATAGGGTSVHTTLSVPAQCSPPFGVTRLLGLPTQTAILVAWHQPFDNGNPITSYRLVADGIPYLVNTLQANGVGQVATIVREYLHYDLIPGTSHTFAVSATNGLGTGPQSNVYTHITANGLAARPEAPTYVFSRWADGQQSLVVMVLPASYSGVYGEGIAFYQLEETLSGANSVPRILNVSSQLSYERARSNVEDYTYRARAVTLAMGPGPWSLPLNVPNDLSNVASEPMNVTILTGGTTTDTG